MAPFVQHTPPNFHLPKGFDMLRHATPMRLCGLLGLALSCVLPARAGTPVVPLAQVQEAYVRPQARIEVEPGRRINLHCQGSGSPTVVFESGLSDWSNTWALIQPAVATRTRACSYDRPGMGASDPSPHPPTPEAVVEDLHRLLAAAGIHGPLVLVGHSLGGFYAKLFAVTHPQQVAGLVLVDPSEERLWPRVRPRLLARLGPAVIRDAMADDADGIREGIAHFQHCASLARAAPLEGDAYVRCTDPVRPQLGPVINEARRQLQPLPAYQQAQADEFAYSMYAPDAGRDARYAKLFGRLALADKPLVVLTHGLWDMTPPFGEADWLSWVTAHRLTAELSTRGVQRMLPMTHHNIQVEQPQAVIAAVDGVLDALAVAQGRRDGGTATP